MKDEHKAHRDGIITEFSQMVKEKYDKGQAEHGGNLWEKKHLIDFAIEEVVDQAVYLLTLKKQIEDAGVELGHLEDDDAVEHKHVVEAWGRDVHSMGWRGICTGCGEFIIKTQEELEGGR